MKFGERRHHRMPYWSRQKAKYKRRLKRKFIPGYGRHRAFSYKQWKNRNYQRAYRYFTFPSVRSAMRAKWEGRNPYNMHGYGRRVSPQAYDEYKRKKTISNWNILFIAFLSAMAVVGLTGHFAKLTFYGVLAWLLYLKFRYYWQPKYHIYLPYLHKSKPQSPYPSDSPGITPQQRKSLQAELDGLKSSLNSLKAQSADIKASSASKSTGANYQNENRQ